MWKRKRNVEEKINFFLGMILILLVVPVFISTFLGRLEIEDLLFSQSTNENSEVELKLPFIVAKQISIQMPQEAIKAQSVIARTQFLAAKERGEDEPAGFSINDLQILWGEQFDEYYAKLESLIKETEGEVLWFDGAYIYAAYHQASAGETRIMSEYYEKSAMPYLSRAICHEDTTATEYLNVFFWTKEEFLTLCNHTFEEVVSSGADIQVVKRDSAGYVLEVQVGQTIYEGEQFRKKLNLPSACFEITLIDEDVRIVTMGQGHGFGLSQHMAGVLAEEGKNYREILQYFYKEVTLIE